MMRPLLLVSFLLAPALAAPSGYSGYSGYDSSTAGYSGYSGYDSSSPGYSGYSGYDSSTAGYSGMGGYYGDGSGSLERTETCEDTIPDCTFLKTMETSAPMFFDLMCARSNVMEGCCATCT